MTKPGAGVVRGSRDMRRDRVGTPGSGVVIGFALGLGVWLVVLVLWWLV